ncbi:hypothetical protein HWV62_28384 [Athelia sp. TMB]|nr:hypothetical protein HWV62_28384 [Athelia sp. TMB]
MEDVSKKLTVATPSKELVDAYLSEIAKAYSVNWSPAPPPEISATDEPEGGGKTDTLDNSEQSLGGEAKLTSTLDGDKTPKLPDIPPTEEQTEAKKPIKPTTPPPTYPEDDFDALTRRFEALKKR